MLLVVAIRDRARTSPKARVVPSTVPTIIVTKPISMLAISDSRSETLLKNSSYHWTLKPEKFWSEGVELNENSATMNSGAKLKNMKRRKNARKKRGRSKPRCRRRRARRRASGSLAAHP